jgi:hypothetical protein
MRFTQVNNDVNGNPRYVVHFLELLKEGETGYETALSRANKIGGRKFHNKQYGGGIVFSCVNTEQLETRINKALQESTTDC